MAKKIFLIPIEGEEEIAVQFVNVICMARGYEQSSPDLTAEQLRQEKLNFVGRIAGILLREIAENKMKQMELDAAAEAIEAKYAGIGDALKVNQVQVVDGENN